MSAVIVRWAFTERARVRWVGLGEARRGSLQNVNNVQAAVTKETPNTLAMNVSSLHALTKSL
jgi:hypothetical protein